MTWEGGGGGGQGSEFFASRTLYFRFLTPSLMAPASVCFFYCEKLRNVAKFASCFSRLPPPWVFPSPALPSPASRRLPAPITPRFAVQFYSSPVLRTKSQSGKSKLQIQVRKTRNLLRSRPATFIRLGI